LKSLYTKFAFVVALLVLVATVMAACGPTDTPVPPTAAPTVAAPTTAPTTAAAPPTATTAAATVAPTMAAPTATAPAVVKPITLTYWTHDLKGNAKFEAYLNGLATAYTAANPSVTVVWQDYAGTDIRTKLLAAIASGSAPDVVNFNTAFTLQFASQGALSDLSTLLDPSQKAMYQPGPLTSANIGTAQYYVPWYITLFVTIYNKALFTQAGLDPNSPPKTQDDLMTMSQAIVAKTNSAYGFQSIASISDEAAIMGFPVLSPDMTKSAINNPQALARLQWYDTLKKGNMIPTTKIGLTDDTTYDEAVKNYEAGKLAVLLSGATLLTQVQKDAPSVYATTGVAPYVLGPSGKVPASIQGFVVPKASANQKPAADLAVFLTNDANQLAFDHLANILPSTVKASQDAFFTQAGTDLVGQAKIVQTGELAIAVDSGLHSPSADALQKAQEAEFAKWWGGQEDAQTALTNTDAAWNKILSAPAQ